jgi:hypothetical protein
MKTIKKLGRITKVIIRSSMYIAPIPSSTFRGVINVLKKQNR